MFLPALFICLGCLARASGFRTPGTRRLFARPRPCDAAARTVPPARHSPAVRIRYLSSSTSDEDAGEAAGEAAGDAPIDVASDPRLRRVRISRATGIEWGTDLSFSYVYVRDMDPAGAASIGGEVEVGDQLCELRPATADGEATNLIGAPFDRVMDAFAGLDRKVTTLDLVFFRGTKDELREACSGDSAAEPETITMTVVQNKGAKDETTRYIQARAGANVRQTLVDNGINVYQSVTRWTNCKGKQLCGTCIVNVKEGGADTNRKSIDESSTLRENPESYRLSCVTFAYGDVTVETFPPIKAAQWTR